MRRGSQRRVVCGLNTHGCKLVSRNALGLSLEQDSGGVAMPLSKRSQDAPGPLSKWSGRVPTLRFRLERIGYLNIASIICSRKHEWGLNTMPHPNFFGF